jgi:hypothetical protein
MWKAGKQIPPSSTLTLDSPLSQIHAIQFFLAMYAIQMGTRFFPHYFLLLMPSLTVLLSVFAFEAERLLLHFCDRINTLNKAVTAWLFRLSMIGMVFLPKTPFLNGTEYQGGPLYFATSKLPLKQISTPRDRIFVWGWHPEIYAVHKRIPASRFSGCATIVYDFGRSPDNPPTDLIAVKVQQLLAELQRTRPLLFIDSSARSYTMSNGAIYDINRYPEIQNYVRENFTFLLDSPDGIKLYIRR